MIGLRIHNYEIRSLLGQGGIGPLYLAVHPWLGRRVVVQFLEPALASNRALLARFLERARAAHAIRHTNVVDLLDVGTVAEGQPYLMRQYLEGEPLSLRLQQSGRLGWPDARAIVEQVAQALSVAHSLGIVHRDLRPEAIFLCPGAAGGRAELVKVLDFGMADLRDQIASRPNDAGQAPARSPLYRAPEQCQGLPVDERTDVYALGAILYHLVCGTPPFAGATPDELLARQRAGPPPSPRTIVQTLSLPASDLMLRTVARRPEDRFPSVAAWLQALAATPGGKESGAGLGSARDPGRKRWLLGRLAAVGGTIGVALALALLPLRPTSSQSAPMRVARPTPSAMVQAQPRPVCPPPAPPCVCPEPNPGPPADRRRPNQTRGPASRDRSVPRW